MHKGSGIHDAAMWSHTMGLLAEAAKMKTPEGAFLYPDLEWLDIGGGLGVRSQAHKNAFDLHALNAMLTVRVVVNVPTTLQARTLRRL